MPNNLSNLTSNRNSLNANYVKPKLLSTMPLLRNHNRRFITSILLPINNGIPSNNLSQEFEEYHIRLKLLRLSNLWSLVTILLDNLSFSTRMNYIESLALHHFTSVIYLWNHYHKTYTITISRKYSIWNSIGHSAYNNYKPWMYHLLYLSVYLQQSDFVWILLTISYKSERKK